MAHIVDRLLFLSNFVLQARPHAASRGEDSGDTERDQNGLLSP